MIGGRAGSTYQHTLRRPGRHVPGKLRLYLVEGLQTPDESGQHSAAYSFATSGPSFVSAGGAPCPCNLMAYQFVFLALLNFRSPPGFTL
jgi:hypothetical protein